MQRAAHLGLLAPDHLDVAQRLAGQPAAREGGAGTADAVFRKTENGVGGAGAALARGRLAGEALRDVEGDLAPAAQGCSGALRRSLRPFSVTTETLCLTAGERGQDDPAAPSTRHAQRVAETLGEVLRLNRDGGLPPDNPVWGAGALPGLWSRRPPQPARRGAPAAAGCG